MHLRRPLLAAKYQQHSFQPLKWPAFADLETILNLNGHDVTSSAQAGNKSYHFLPEICLGIASL
jgi:hypothetical protein